jgi:hypothetical protein
MSLLRFCGSTALRFYHQSLLGMISIFISRKVKAGGTCWAHMLMSDEGEGEGGRERRQESDRCNTPYGEFLAKQQ